jgi:hypothetical protein
MGDELDELDERTWLLGGAAKGETRGTRYRRKGSCLVEREPLYDKTKWISFVESYSKG